MLKETQHTEFKPKFKVKTNTQPQIIPDVDFIEIDGKEVIEFRIQEYPVKPVSTRGKYYKRVKNSNHQLSVQEISDIYMQSMQYSWDAYLAQNYTYADLDENKIQKFINKVNEKGRFSLAGSPQECLEKLRYIAGNKITNAAVLLFAKEEIAHNVHIGRLKTPTLIIDDRIIKKTLFETVDEIMKYIVSQIKFAFEIKGYSTQRTEIPEYPIEAIRETVLNAVIHRDYLLPYDIQIKIFDKEITIYNPGKLSGNLSFEDLKTDNYQAYARNKLLAEAFYLTGDIEKYGSGFRRIREHIEVYPTMKTEFKEIPNGLLFTYSYIVQKNSTQSPYYTPEMLDDDTRKDVLKVENTQVGVQVGVQVEKLLSVLEENTVFSTKEIQKQLNLKQRHKVFTNYIQPALKFGLIEMTIPDKPNSRLQKYCLTEKGLQTKATTRK